MTDREALFRYRLAEAEETLADARMMLASGVSTATFREVDGVVNCPVSKTTIDVTSPR